MQHPAEDHAPPRDFLLPPPPPPQGGWASQEEGQEYGEGQDYGDYGYDEQYEDGQEEGEDYVDGEERAPARAANTSEGGRVLIVQRQQVGGSGPATPPLNTDQQLPPNFKTALCRHWQQGGCSHGDRCTYAHGEHELRRPDRMGGRFLQHGGGAGRGRGRGPPPGKERTVTCRYWLDGNCRQGERCTFLHGYPEQQQRAPAAPGAQPAQLPPPPQPLQPLPGRLPPQPPNGQPSHPQNAQHLASLLHNAHLGPSGPPPTPTAPPPSAVPVPNGMPPPLPPHPGPWGLPPHMSRPAQPLPVPMPLPANGTAHPHTGPHHPPPTAHHPPAGPRHPDHIPQQHHQQQQVQGSNLTEEMRGMLRRRFSSLLCPLTHEPFVDPVVAADGNIYERQAIEDWIYKKGNDTSPLTNERLNHKMVMPCGTMRRCVEEVVAFVAAMRQQVL